MPPAPLETKYHPSAVDLLLIKRLIAETSKQNLLQFLQHEFVNVGKAHAERLIGKTCMQLLLFKKNNAGFQGFEIWKDHKLQEFISPLVMVPTCPLYETC